MRTLRPWVGFRRRPSSPCHRRAAARTAARAVTVSGFGFARGARPGIWFGTIGPIAARRLGDDEEPSLECVSPAGTPRGRRRGRDRGPGRGFFDAVPVSASAAGTEALRTSRVVGYAPEDIASRLAASYVILPSKFASSRMRVTTTRSRDVVEFGVEFVVEFADPRRLRRDAVDDDDRGATIWISGSYLRAARGAFGCARGRRRGDPRRGVVRGCPRACRPVVYRPAESRPSSPSDIRTTRPRTLVKRSSNVPRFRTTTRPRCR